MHAAHAKKKGRCDVYILFYVDTKTLGDSCQYFIMLLCIENNTLTDSSAIMVRQIARAIKKSCKTVVFPATYKVGVNCNGLQNKLANDSHLCHNTAARVCTRVGVHLKRLRNRWACIVGETRVKEKAKSRIPLRLKAYRCKNKTRMYVAMPPPPRRLRSVKSRRNGKWVKRRLHEWTVLCSQGDYEVAAAASRNAILEYMTFPSETRAPLFFPINYALNAHEIFTAGLIYIFQALGATFYSREYKLSI